MGNFNSTLFDAAAKGQVEKLRAAIAAHPDLIDAPNPKQHNRTPLHAAARMGHVDAVRLLDSCGASSAGVDALGLTALTAAAMNGHTAVVELLMARGCSPLLFDSIVHLAANNGHAETLRVLLRAQGGLRQQQLREALKAAIDRGHFAVVSLLVEFDPMITDCPDFWDTHLYSAASVGHPGILTVLLRANDRFVTDPVMAAKLLDRAASRGNADAVQALLDAGLDRSLAQSHHYQPHIQALLTRHTHQSMQTLLLRWL